MPASLCCHFKKTAFLNTIIHIIFSPFQLFNMKKLLFAFPVLAIMLSLAFCTKSDVQQLTETTNPGAVGDRAPCNIEVYSDNIHAVRFCGTLMNKNVCTSCSSAFAQGTAVVNGNGAVVAVESPLQFSVRTDSPGGSYINLVGPNGPTGFVYIPAGGCHTYSIDAGCNIIP